MYTISVMKKCSYKDKEMLNLHEIELLIEVFTLTGSALSFSVKVYHSYIPHCTSSSVSISYHTVHM